MNAEEITRRYVTARGDPVHDLLLDLLGGPKGNAASIELDALLASGRWCDVELPLDAKRPATRAGRSFSPLESSAPEVPGLHDLSSADAMVADGFGVLHTNKETPT